MFDPPLCFTNLHKNVMFKNCKICIWRSLGFSLHLRPIVLAKICCLIGCSKLLFCYFKLRARTIAFRICMICYSYSLYRQSGPFGQENWGFWDWNVRLILHRVILGLPLPHQVPGDLLPAQRAPFLPLQPSSEKIMSAKSSKVAKNVLALFFRNSKN